MRRLVLFLCVSPLAAGAQEGTVPDAPRGGEGRSAIEARIAEFNPCEPLGAEIAGFTFGVGQVRDVEVESANLSLDGDGISFRISGRLTCRGEGRPPEQDLSADVLISVDGILSTCEIKGSEVNLSNAEGEMAWAFGMAAPVIAGLLTDRIEDRAVETCTELAR